MQPQSKKIFSRIIIATLIIAVYALFSSLYTAPTLTIVLSPHFDDAALSLGGLLAQKNTDRLVVTFFTSAPEKSLVTQWDTISGFRNSDEAISSRTKENANAFTLSGSVLTNLHYLDYQYRDHLNESQIRAKMIADIQKIINEHTEKNIEVYGPATFGSVITHPDHALLHEAFIQVALRNLDNKHIHFYIYEDIPYTLLFLKENASVKTFLENTDKLYLTEHSILLSKEEVGTKKASIAAYHSQIEAFNSLGEDVASESETYTRSRCRVTLPFYSGCEMTYEIIGSGR
jgi:LmbE family N-acetylglucosaminyl deacetylase